MTTTSLLSELLKELLISGQPVLVVQKPPQGCAKYFREFTEKMHNG
jgi:hypothetical protein